MTGCGKTLSFKLASDNLIGVSSNHTFLFQSMSKILVSSYQCSESTTASEVSLLFKRAEERQSNFDRYQTELFGQERCCVFLDEVVGFNFRTAIIFQDQKPCSHFHLRVSLKKNGKR
jgi:hypothetical protein